MDALAELPRIVWLLVLAVILWVYPGRGLWRRWRDGRVTIYDHEVGLRIRDGKIEETLGPGRYATWPEPVEIERLDLRARTTTNGGQEVLTADSLAVKLTAWVRFRITDPVRYRRAAIIPESLLYEAGQIALRQRAGAHRLDALLAERGLIEADLAGAIGALTGDLGVMIEEARLRDFTVSGAAKQALADLWKAQKEGQAALDRARGEQASLRALANAARLLKGNPELMNLRILQAASGKPGAPAATIVLGGAGGLLPVGQNTSAADAPIPDDLTA